MKEYEKLNRILNQSQRVLDELAREVVDTEFAPIKKNVGRVVRAIELISKVQASLWQRVPDLAFHFEPGRPDTALMARVRQLVADAKSLEADNATDQAIQKLRQALELEPPALDYEVIAAEIDRLQKP